MSAFAAVLQLGAAIFLAVGLLHLMLGPAADVLLGATLSSEALSDPVLDSQNRFYGVCFTVYGFLLYLCATDMQRYSTVFQICIWVFFAGGLARLVSVAMTGLPTPPVIALLATEIAAPPILALWYRNVRTKG